MAPPKSVVVHPIVLLSAVDHYNRVAKDTKKRVVGILLGEWSKGTVDVLNSYAVPFEEDERDPTIWFLDHNFHENMYSMFKKVNAREKVIGWYSSGPKIKPGDLAIDAIVRRYTPNPVFVIIDVKPKELGIPTEAYYAAEEVRDDGSPSTWTFKHVPSEIGALEAEEVGVEHLLRDVKDMTISTLANQITGKVAAIKGLMQRLTEIEQYLQNVIAGRVPINHQIIYQLQDVFNLLPNLNVDELQKAFAVKTNDMMLAIYLASIIRSTLALHNLINNKLVNKEKERSADGKDKPKSKPKEGDKDKKKDEKDKKDDKEKDKKDTKDA